MPRPPFTQRALRSLLVAGLVLAPSMAHAADTAQPTLDLAPQPAAPVKAAPKAPAPGTDPVVATVDATKIRSSDLEEAQHEMGRPIPYDQLLERQENLALLIAAGRADKLENDPKVKDTMARLENRVIMSAYIERLQEKVVNDAALKAKFDQMNKGKAPPEEVQARHILVATEDEAKAIIAELDKGADFAKLADEKSTDKGESGGELGWFTKDKMVPAFADAAFALKKGEYTKTPVHSQFGWHVILLEDRRTTKPPTFEDSKDQIKNALIQEAVESKIKELRAKAKIAEFNPDGSPKTADATPAPAPAAAPAAKP